MNFNLNILQIYALVESRKEIPRKSGSNVSRSLEKKRESIKNTRETKKYGQIEYEEVEKEE